MKRKLLLLIIYVLAIGGTLFAQVFVEISEDAKEDLASAAHIYAPDKLAKRITRRAKSDEEKVRSIYLWITGHVKYDARRFRNGSAKMQSSRKTLWRKKALCNEYAALFNEMCKAAGVVSYTVTGYVKGYYYEKDDTLFNADHAWNLVKVNNKWKLLDLTFAAGYLQTVPYLREYLHVVIRKPLTRSKLVFTKQRNDLYYFTSPHVLVRDHLPSVPVFQLLEPQVSMSTFQHCVSSNCMDSAQADRNIEFATAPGFYEIASAREKHLWIADSAYAFNNRNIFEQAIGLNQAGIAQLLETGKKNKRGKIKLGNDLNTLEGASLKFDSSNKLVPGSKMMIREEVKMGLHHNKYRSFLANQTIAPLRNANLHLSSLADPLPHFNKKAVNNYREQNKAIEKTIGYYRKAIFNAHNGGNKISDEEKMNMLGYNSEKIKSALDTIQKIKTEVDELFKRINDSLIYFLEVNQSRILLNHKQMIDLTRYAITLRYNHEDNLDETLANIVNSRDLCLAVLQEKMRERKSMKSDLQKRQLDMKNAIYAIRYNLSECKPMMKSNTVLGKDESESFYAVIATINSQLELLAIKNDVVSAFLEGERVWAKTEKQLCRRQKRLLATELFYENHRRMVKEDFILARQNRYNRIAKMLRHNNTANIRVIKRKIKKAAR